MLFPVEMLSMTLWKVEGAFFIPYSLYLYSKLPLSMLNAVFSISFGSSSIWCEPDAKSKVEKYWNLLNWSKKLITFVNSYIIVFYFLFRWCPFFFGTLQTEEDQEPRQWKWLNDFLYVFYSLLYARVDIYKLVWDLVYSPVSILCFILFVNLSISKLNISEKLEYRAIIQFLRHLDNQV